MNYRKFGFTQRKPKQPGVYLISWDRSRSKMNPPPRHREGWEIADVYFWAGSYGSVYENREEFAHWRLHTLSGLEFAWRPGMWIKGPIRIEDSIGEALAAIGIEVPA